MSKYIPSSASNNTSITKVNKTQVTRGPSNYEILDDFDNSLCPPALSPYALSILDDKLGGRYNKKLGRSSSTVKENHYDMNTQSKHTINSIATNEITTSSKTGNINNSTYTSTSISRHSKFMKKLGLGAPRRLTINGDFQVTNTHTKTNDSIQLPEAINSDQGLDTKSINAVELQQHCLKDDKEGGNIRKHPIQLTPHRYSPVNKKVTPNKTNLENKSMSTPTKGEEYVNQLLDSPEVARKALVPLSAEKKNAGIIDVFNNNGYELNLDKNKENVNLSVTPNFNHLQTLADKKKEIYQLKKEIKQYKEELSRQKSIHEQEIQKERGSGKRDGTSNTDTIDEVQINKRKYRLYEQIGKGGSSKVYRGSVADTPNRFFAIKIVNLEDHDVSTIQELKGEIKILHKLRHCPRVVRLLDYSLTAKHIYFVMECGNLDLATVLSNRHSLPRFYDLEFVRYHAQEMIKCIDTIHELDVVHLDLKPANFVFVSGMLKLIDFGISNSIKGHTVNVYREFQMGTPNYMAPETLIDCAENENGLTIWKVGKPADIWSLGCILYQLTYGATPYASYNGTKKILAITNPSICIDYPTIAVNLRKKEDGNATKGEDDVKVCPYLIDMIRKCLIRDTSRRIKSKELLEHLFIKPIVVDKTVIREVVRGCVGFGGRHPELKNVALGMSSSEQSKEDKKSQERLDRLIDGVWKRVNGDRIE